MKLEKAKKLFQGEWIAFRSFVTKKGEGFLYN